MISSLIIRYIIKSRALTPRPSCSPRAPVRACSPCILAGQGRVAATRYFTGTGRCAGAATTQHLVIGSCGFAFAADISYPVAGAFRCVTLGAALRRGSLATIASADAGNLRAFSFLGASTRRFLSPAI